jgi:hypothetical protein
VRLGIGFRLAPGIRLWVPLGHTRRRRPEPTHTVYVHDGCPVQHRFERTARRCAARMRSPR